jgi:nucleobase:cation symporter-1, NCS1 family
MTIIPSVIQARVVEKRRNATQAFKSWDEFKKWVMVPDTALDEHSHTKGGITWSNIDLDPTPPERRTWRWWNCKEIPVVIFQG